MGDWEMGEYAICPKTKSYTPPPPLIKRKLILTPSHIMIIIRLIPPPPPPPPTKKSPPIDSLIPSCLLVVGFLTPVQTSLQMKFFEES